MSHDQLFKELLPEFFREFMELFFPRVAARLDFTRVTFLDKELFTDLIEGDQREADLIAQVYTLDGQPEIVLLHVEVERQRRLTFPARMHDYYHALRLRKKAAVYPIVVYLSPGAGGLVRETHVDMVFDEEVDRFTYQAVGLPDLSADDYRDSENILASGLSALMRVSALGKAVQKEWSLRRVAQSAENEARKFLLVNVIESYLPLAGPEAQEFERLTQQPEAQGVREMISIYEERGIEKGIAIGERNSLLKVLRRKFGELPQTVTAHIEAIASEEELDALFDRAFDADTLDDMGLSASAYRQIT